MHATAIKTMNLYSRADRVFNDLKAIGYGPEDDLSVQTLSRFDQYHYFGTDAVDVAIATCGIGSDSRVLDIGSGIGGPARHLAQASGCHVTAIELQSDLDEVARELTRRCRLAVRIDHRCGDVLDQDFESANFDAVVSWLCFYHIPDRRKLLQQCFKALRPGGMLYVEDMYALGAFTPGEQRQVDEMLYGNYLPSAQTYRDDLRDAGFGQISFLDMTVSWTAFVNDRRDGYRADRARNVDVHGAAIVDGMEAFYDMVAGLFNAGHLGGARVVAYKP